MIHKGRGGSHQESILERVRCKLDGWKSTCLSRAGRFTLAKSVISSMCIFYMQAQRLTKKTHSELDKAARRCIWGSSPTKKKIHLLNWETLCKTKKRGGAGIRRSEDIHKSLLTKLGWRILTSGKEPWCKIIREKYGLVESRPLAFRNRQRETQVWKGVVWASDVLREGLS